MKIIIEENHVVTLTYELRDGDAKGELMERMDARYPFIFLFGTGKLLQSFEENLRGLGSDDSFEFILSAEEAYGKWNALNVLKIPKEDFNRASDVPDNYVKIDNRVNLTDDEGLRHNGKIIGIEDTQIEIDFNHAMVDKALHFKGAVLAIREASVEELVQKHYIEESGIRK